MADFAAGVWAAPVLRRDYHQGPEQFGGWLGLAVLLGGLLGAALGGFAADLGHKQQISQRHPDRRGCDRLALDPRRLLSGHADTLGFGLLLGLLLLCGAATGLITAPPSPC